MRVFFLSLICFISAISLQGQKTSVHFTYKGRLITKPNYRLGFMYLDSSIDHIVYSEVVKKSIDDTLLHIPTGIREGQYVTAKITYRDKEFIFQSIKINDKSEIGFSFIILSKKEIQQALKSGQIKSLSCKNCRKVILDPSWTEIFYNDN